MPGDEDSRAGRRVTKTLTPGAGFRRKLAIPPQGALTRVAAPPRGEWRCAHSPQRPASAAAAVTREHFAWRLADSAGGMRGGDDGVPAAMAACAVADSVMNGCSERKEPAAAAAAAAASTPHAQYAASSRTAQLHDASKPTSSPRQPAPEVLVDNVVRADAGLVGIAAAGRPVRMAPRIARGCDTAPFASVRVFDRPASALRGGLSVCVRY